MLSPPSIPTPPLVRSSLVKACTAAELANASRLDLVFIPSSNSDWVHVAEVWLYSDENTCQPDSIIANYTSEITTKNVTDYAHETMHSGSTGVFIPVIITAVATALLCTVNFVLVLIAVCKCLKPKVTPEDETVTPAGEEGQICNNCKHVDDDEEVGPI